MPASTFFRACVGAVLCNVAREVLAFERRDVRGAWQLPQGGIESGEAPEDAVLREVEEETGIPGRGLALLARHPDLLAYELPPEHRSAKTGRGQVQYWFYFALPEGAEPVLPPGGEFRAWRWTPLPSLAEETVAFRRPVYRALVDHLPRERDV